MKSVNRPPSPSGGARRLPTVRIAGKLYFMDERLREFRRVDDPFDRIAFAAMPAYEVVVDA